MKAVKLAAMRLEKAARGTSSYGKRAVSRCMSAGKRYYSDFALAFFDARCFASLLLPLLSLQDHSPHY